ncbi:hypothetical protein LUW77_14955 [Streptomyces radiopugnans]|nr:hypothetical protein LUW77_14955 [Streptomyces radiopugnans]
MHVDTLKALTSTEVFDALAAIGIGDKRKGGVSFAAEIQRDGPGWRAEVDLPRGVEASKVLEKRAALAAAMRRPVSTVWPEADPAAHPGRLVLWVAQQDPAKAPRRLWPLMKAGTADVFKPLPFGFDPRGNLVTVTLMYSNLLVGGIPGSGKTSCALAIVLGVALDPTAELWVYELKGSGDMDSVKPVCHRYVSGDDDEDIAATVANLRSGIAEQKRRAKFIKSLPSEETPDGRRVTRELAEKYPGQQLGPRVIVVDEAQELFTHPEHGQEAADLCTKLIKKGRAYGIILILLTQNPDATALPTSVSSSVGTRLCLAVMDWRANNNVLGTGAHERGLRATEISASEQGTGILARGREGGTVRAAFIKQTEAEQIGKRALALRTALRHPHRRGRRAGRRGPGHVHDRGSPARGVAGRGRRRPLPPPGRGAGRLPGRAVRAVAGRAGRRGPLHGPVRRLETAQGAHPADHPAGVLRRRQGRPPGRPPGGPGRRRVGPRNRFRGRSAVSTRPETGFGPDIGPAGP